MTKYKIISENYKENLIHELERFSQSHDIISLHYSTALSSGNWSGSVVHSVLIEYTTIQD